MTDPQAQAPSEAPTECNCDPLAQTGGGHAITCPEYEPECTCYELIGGHQPGCPYGAYLRSNRRPVDPILKWAPSEVTEEQEAFARKLLDECVTTVIGAHQLRGDAIELLVDDAAELIAIRDRASAARIAELEYIAQEHRRCGVEGEEIEAAICAAGYDAGELETAEVITEQSKRIASLEYELAEEKAARARLEEELQRIGARRFRIQNGPSLPWRMMEPHETQALANHAQTLAQLHARGGLCCTEAVAVLEDKPWRAVRGMTEDAAKQRLNELIEAFHASERRGEP